MRNQPETDSVEFLTYHALRAVYVVMDRGMSLVHDAVVGLATGEPTDLQVLAATAAWLADLFQAHAVWEARFLAAALPERFTGQASGEEQEVSAALARLARTTREMAGTGLTGLPAFAAAVGLAALQGVQESADGSRLLTEDLRAREVIAISLPAVLNRQDTERLVSGALENALRTGPHYVFGLLEDPEPPAGYPASALPWPADAHSLRQDALRRYRRDKRALGA